MNIPAQLDQCVAALVKAFPVEDVWYLESQDAKECGLEKASNLVVVVRQGAEPHLVEHQARELMEKEFPAFDVYAFPQSAIYNPPRPLLVKMAFTAGRSVYCR